MHYIVVTLFIAGIMPSAGLRYRSQIGRRVARRYDTRETFPSTLRDLFPRCCLAVCEGRVRERGEREVERERQSRMEKPRLIAYRPFVSKVGLARPQFLRGRFVPRRTGISWTRIAALSKDLCVIIAARRDAARLWGMTVKISTSSRDFSEILFAGMVANRQMSATHYNYRWLDM